MVWEPQAGPQTSALLADWCDEVFYGGERGGGKSDFQLGYQEDGALQYGKHWRGIMFRKTYPELEELQARAVEIFPGSGAIYKTQPSAGFPYSNSWYWPSGATVKMRFIENEKDYGKYHGHSYTGISFDEVTEYAVPGGLLKMLSTLRSPYGVPCGVRLTGNPGGVGHGWVKERYISPAPPLTPYNDPDTGFTRMFIPSKMDDNQILLESDPNYRNRIKAATAGNKVLERAWLYGDWDIIAGAFFENWDKNRHVVSPFRLPADWPVFISGDWGSAKPFSFGWWAVVTDDYRTREGVVLPRGCLVRFREWYGCKEGQYNVGLKMTAKKVGKGIAERNKSKKIFGVIDPAAFTEDGGPSIAEEITKGSGQKVFFRKADNKRVSKRGAIGGWDQVRDRLDGENSRRPMMVFFSTCVDAIRTLPIMQHDKLNPEDVDTNLEDHAPDEVRYACMSRPWVRPADENTETEPQDDYRPIGEQEGESWRT
jgi:hypothetical protein